MPERQRTKRPPIDLAAELERAVERNEFGLEYQPIIDLGWRRSVYGVLTRDGSRLRLAVHEMKSPREAVALFDQNVSSDTEPASVGEKAVIWDRGEFSKGILFRKMILYCELVFEKEGGQAELLDLASSLATRIE